MSKQASLSTIIDYDLKKAMSAFCRKKGLKIQSFLEKAILDQLEDEIDIQAYLSRKDEVEVDLEVILSRTHKKK